MAAFNTSTDRLTDLYYGCLDGPDDIDKDVFTGRLLVNKPEDLPVILKKLMRYPYMGKDEPAFHANATHMAHYQAEYRIDCESRLFVKTSEEIRKHAMNNGMTVSRIYNKDENSVPTYWDSRTGHMTLMPSELRSPSFDWNGGVDEIVDGFNMGNLYMLYRGHGYFMGWSNPSFSKNDIARLRNKDKLPIVFSITCNTGNFRNSWGFARNMMISENGCASMIASEDESWSGYNDAFALGIFSQIWPSPEYDTHTIVLNDSTIKIVEVPLSDALMKPTVDIDKMALGRIMSAAEKYYYIQYGGYNSSMIKEQKELYHIFGDPGLWINTKSPTNITDPHISVIEDDVDKTKYRLRVYAKDKSVIGYYNETTDDVLRSYRYEFETSFKKTDKVRVALQQWNHVPLIFDISGGKL